MHIVQSLKLLFLIIVVVVVKELFCHFVSEMAQYGNALRSSSFTLTSLLIRMFSSL